MALVGELQFTQGITIGPPGEAFIATLAGGAVTCANANNALALAWTYQLLDVPIGSALSTSAPFSSGSSPTGSFTPDVAGAYQVMLTVDGVGNTQATDVRTVLVETANRGWIMPAFEDTNLTLNYPDPSTPNKVGWKDSLNKIFADLDAKGFFVDKSLGAADTNVLAWNAGAGHWAPASAGGGSSVTGTGFWHSTSGSLDPAAAIVLTQPGTSAAAGFVRGNNNVTTVAVRNAANSADLSMLATVSNAVIVGDSNNTQLSLRSGTEVEARVAGTAYLSLKNLSTDFLALGGASASAGLLRVSNNATAVAARNAANTQNIPLLGTDGSNNVQLGDSAAAQGALTVLNGTTGLSLKVAGNQVGSIADASSDFIRLGIGGTGYAVAGALRFGDVAGGSAFSIIQGRNHANSADIAIVSVNGAGTTQFGDPANFGVLAGVTCKISCTSGSYEWRVNQGNLVAAGHALLNVNAVGTVPFVFDSSDNTATSWDFKINSTLLASITASKFISAKGIRRAVRRTATSTTLTTSDDVLIFSATGQTATLPASPTAGDKYTVGIDAAATTNTFSVTFGVASNIIVQGAAVTTLTVTTNAASFQAYTLTYTGSFWVACPGY